MKVAILAGGVGSRLGTETESKPKPLVEIGGMPILWHIMRLFCHAGLHDFVIALGYRGDAIKRYVTERHDQQDRKWQAGEWQVELVETGLKTQTGGRIKRLQPHLQNETFMLAWGDGLFTADLEGMLSFHRGHGRLATVLAVRPPARFGHLEFDGDRVIEFSEKPQAAEGWINGGVFVLEPGIFEYIDGDRTHWEREPMEDLAAAGELMAFRHEGYWQCMDTPRDLALLNRLWASGQAPWRRA